MQRGSKVSFECKVKHDHTLIPTIMWLKDHGELPNEERYLFQEALVPLPSPWRLLLCQKAPDTMLSVSEVSCLQNYEISLFLLP